MKPEIKRLPVVQDKHFSAEVSDYTLVLLPLEEFKSSTKPLAVEYAMLNSDRLTGNNRRREKILLRSNFVGWRNPYFGKINGFRHDSGMYALWNDVLVGGVYLAENNELSLPHWGQLHYAFLDETHRGHGLYHFLVGLLVETAQSWGLEGIVINTDRVGHPEMYQRWGGTYHSSHPKSGFRVVLGRIHHLIYR